jgi:hypothetical protein
MTTPADDQPLRLTCPICDLFRVADFNEEDTESRMARRERDEVVDEEEG